MPTNAGRSSTGRSKPSQFSYARCQDATAACLTPSSTPKYALPASKTLRPSSRRATSPNTNNNQSATTSQRIALTNHGQPSTSINRPKACPPESGTTTPGRCPPRNITYGSERPALPSGRRASPANTWKTYRRGETTSIVSCSKWRRRSAGRSMLRRCSFLAASRT